MMVLFINCGGGAGDEKELENLYRDYHKALQKEDTEALKGFITSQRQKELLGEGASFKLKIIKELIPPDIEITKTNISGNKAELEVEGKKDNQKMTGKVNFLKESSGWKIDKENWQMTIEMGAGRAGPFIKDPKKPPRVQQVLSGHQGEVTNLAFTPDGFYLVSVSYGDFSLRVWDPAAGEELSNARTPKRVRGMAILPDGSGILTADAYNKIIFWPLRQGTIGTPETLARDAGDALAISPDGKNVVTAGWNRPFQVWDFEKSTVIETLEKKSQLRVLAFSPSGKWLACGGKGNTFSIWNTKKWNDKTYRVRKVMNNSGVSSIDITADEKYLATGHSDSSIVIFDLEEREELHNFYVRDAAAMAVKFTLDGKYLATAQYDKKIYLWETKTRKRTAVLSRHTDVPVSLAFNPNGNIMASGGEDRKIILWSADPLALTVRKPPPATPAAATGATAPLGPVTEEVDGVPNLIKYPDAGRFNKSWNTKGEVSVEMEQTEDGDNYLFAIRYCGMIWQDAVLKETAGRYALLIAWASSERINADREQTGLPYLYGYMLNKKDHNKIDAYLKGQQMLLSGTTPDEWEVIYGIFEIPPETGAIRFFMQQADGREPQNGSAARFDQPGLFLFNSIDEAREFAGKY